MLRRLLLTFMVTALVGPASSSPLAAQVQLQEGRTVQGSLASGDTARYTIEAGDDSFVYGEVDQISVDVLVRILNDEGEQRGRFDGPGRGGERFAGRIAEAGTYSIEVLPAGEDRGDFAITIHRLEPAETDPKKLTDQLMARYDGDGYPGAAVQVWRDGRTIFSKAYGTANLAYGIPFETDTRTNIGSTSKQFTAFAIMLQAERGALSLDDDIRTHVPELPDLGETVTVRHILTHTSGLREFLNLVLMEGRRLDRGDWIDRSELIDIVQRQPALQNSPGSEWNYNNTAFGLAALIVERTSGQAFHEYMQDNVFGPLAMTRTMVRPSPHHIVEDASEGYTPGPDGYLQIGDLGGAVGAGGIYSTVEDLQIWAENYANPRVGNAAMIEEMMTSYVLTNGEETGYGYGLGVGEQRGLRQISHNGADVAHRSNFAYYPDINAGITVQSNNAEFDSSIALRLAAAFFADAMESEGEEAAPTDFDPAAYDPEDFDAFVGRYALDAAPTFILTFTREDGAFYTQATGQQRLEIVPVSDSTFALTAVEASVTFHRNDDGEVDRLVLHQNGNQPATRLADDAEVEEWAPTADELDDFVGRYFSEEVETFFTVSLDDAALTLSQRRLDDSALEPGDPDEFAGGGFELAFERDRNGQVVAFYMSNGRTRDVRFERVR